MVERVGKSYALWLTSLEGRPEKSRKQTISYVEHFLDWVGWSFEELYEKYHAATLSNDPRDTATINGTLVSYYRELRKRGKSPGHAKNNVSAVVSFLTENGLFVNFNKQQRKEMSNRALHFKDNFSREDIQNMLKVTPNARNQALIHCLKDTGMSVSDLNQLNVSDLREALNDEHKKFHLIEYSRVKTGEIGSPCLGYESLEALRLYMRWRKQEGYSCADNSPLFILIKGKKEQPWHTEEELMKGIRLSGSASTTLIKNIIRRAGISDKRVSAHSFRVYNASALESAGVNKNLVYRLQGRVIPDSGRAYSKGEVLTSYMKAYDSLCVGVKPVVIEVEDSRVEQLEKRILELQELVYEKLTKEKD